MSLELTINIFDYLSPAEVAEECKIALRGCVRDIFSKETEINRLISNLGYEFLFEEISKSIRKDATEAISDIVKKLAADESHIRYLMWRRKDAWEHRESPAIGILDKAIEDSTDLIKATVENAIAGYELPDVRDAIYDMACDVIAEKLFGKRGESV